MIGRGGTAEDVMDTSVALVQAYLHVNGYFTVAEYPVLEVLRGEHPRTVTDLDLLAFRFPGAGHEIIRGRTLQPLGGRPFAPDPVLGCPVDRADMIVGEVKESAARFNDATRDPAVLAVALARFGCCPPEHVDALTRRLLRRGHAVTPAGHAVRMVAFGDAPDPKRRGAWTTVPIGHVVEFLREYLRAHWQILRHAQLRDPVLGVLALIEKWDATGTAGPDDVRAAGA
jgi:hypothetical protein